MRRFIVSIAWAVLTGTLSVLLTTPYVETVYADRVARGGDPAFGDLGFASAGIDFLMGLCALLLGMFGKLPGTK